MFSVSYLARTHSQLMASRYAIVASWHGCLVRLYTQPCNPAKVSLYCVDMARCGDSIKKFNPIGFLRLSVVSSICYTAFQYIANF